MLVVSSPTTTTATSIDPISKASNLSTIANLKANQKATTIQSPFWFGGAASCLATFVSHPFDLTKVRLQTLRVENSTAWSEFKLLSPARMFKTMWYISRTEGITALYNGLSASLLRQGTYSTIRFGLYDQFKWSVARDQSKLYILKIIDDCLLTERFFFIRTHCTSITFLFNNGRCIRRSFWKP